MINFLQYHITKLSEKTDGEMEQNDNKDIDQALKDLEGSLGTTSLNNKVGYTTLLYSKVSYITTLNNKVSYS